MWILMGMVLLFLGICTYTDLRRREIGLLPAVVTLAAAILYRGIRGIYWEGYTELGLRLVPGMVLLLLSLLWENRVGLGDGIMVAVCGYALGADYGMRTALISFVLAGAYGTVMKITRKQKSLPLAPFLLAGFIICAGIEMGGR